MSTWLNDMELMLGGDDPGSFEGDATWRTRDGRTMRVSDMADPHLLATIRMLRGRKFPHPALRYMLREAESRGLKTSEPGPASPALPRPGESNR